MDQAYIRNFAIVAHVDHGKSTLADRLLEITGTVPAREMREQFLDSLMLERERGITIKLKAVRLNYQLQATSYQLNMIDTPGHVDFGYEVSRSLAACEGAVLVVDASQGVQAQTVANVYKALDHGLKIIPFINKIDLSVAQPEETAEELANAFGFTREEMIFGSARQGLGIVELLHSVIEKIPPPSGNSGSPLRALIFDSVFDEHKGVIAFVKIVDGSLDLSDLFRSKQKLKFLATGAQSFPVEVGELSPMAVPKEGLSTGEVGYVATGLKEIRLVRVGDTITNLSIFPSTPSVYARSGEDRDQAKTDNKFSILNSSGSARSSEARQFSIEALPGYVEPKPMIFLGLYPLPETSFLKLRLALSKLRLTDGSLSCTPESGGTLGMGFRCGFLGLLHAEVVQERLERDYQLKLISTTPSVSYEIHLNDGSAMILKRAADLPDMSGVREILEPYVRSDIFVPEIFSGPVLKLIESYRAKFVNREYLGRVLKLTFEMPLSEIMTDFYDRLKSVSSGFASLDYTFIGNREGGLRRLDILVAGSVVAPLSQIVPRERAYEIGRKLLSKLKEAIDRHQFVVILQAVIGGKVVAREEIPALRKNVLAKMSGGHRERKDKLLERQREGKARLKDFGKVSIPQKAFWSILERS